MAIGPAPAPTAGLRKATIVLFWCTVGSTALVALTAVNRRSVFDGYRDGSNSIFDVDDADVAFGGASFVQVALTIASVIVLSIWSLRAGRNAKRLGATNVSPGLACGSWYIPFGNLVVPFVQLRRMVRHFGRSTSAVSLWQGLFIVGNIASGSVQSIGTFEAGEPEGDVANRLAAQSVVAFIVVVLFAAMAAVATRALRDVDGVSPART